MKPLEELETSKGPEVSQLGVCVGGCLCVFVSKTVYTSNWRSSVASEFAYPCASNEGDWDPGASHWAECLSPATGAIHIIDIYMVTSGPAREGSRM